MFDSPITDQKIGFVGIGQMGLPMAQNILEAGYTVGVYDVRPDAVDAVVNSGGEAADSPADLASDCSSVHIGVVNDKQVDSVVRGDTGVFAGFRRHDSVGLLVVHSTVLPETVTSLSEDAPEGVTVLDAAMSGGKPRAEEGDLTLMVGGEKSAVEYYRPVFELLSRDIFHLGRLGSGLATKLANNLIFHATEFATLEAIDLGTKYGVDEAQLRAVFEHSTGDNYFLRNYDFFTDEYLRTHPAGPHATARNAQKNLYQALLLAKSLQVEVSLTALASQRVPSLWRELADEIESEND